MLQGSSQPVSPKRDRSLVTAFPSPATAALFRSHHSRVDGTGLLLRFLAASFAVRSALLLCDRCPVCPGPGRVNAFWPVTATRAVSTRRYLGLRSPLGFYPLRIKAFSRFRCQSVRLPNSPDSLSLPAAGSFSIAAADQRSRVATFPEACCSSNLLEPHSLCSEGSPSVKAFLRVKKAFPQYLCGVFRTVYEGVQVGFLWIKRRNRNLFCRKCSTSV
jgi:hypothetical protein